MLRLEDVRTLVEIGYIGLSAGLHDHAAAVFDGVQAACPSLETGIIGRALVDIARRNLGEAIRALRSLPPTDAAQAFLGMALIHNGDYVEARSILLDVCGSPCNDPATKLAHDLLLVLDTAPAPLGVVR